MADMDPFTTLNPQYERKRRDVAYGGAYFVALIIQLCLGGYYTSQSDGSWTIPPEPDYCFDNNGRRLMSVGANASDDGFSLVFKEIAQHQGVFVASIVLVFVVALFWVWLLKTFARPIVWSTVGLSSCIPFVAGFYILHLCSEITADNKAAGMMDDSCGLNVQAYFFFGWGLLTVLAVYYYRKRIDASAALLKQSCECLKSESGVFGYAVVGKLLMYGYLALSFYLMIGTLVGGTTWVRATIDNIDGETIQTCALTFPYYAIVYQYMMLFWSLSLVQVILTYTAAGNAAAWYFQVEVPNPATTFVKHATTTSFGSNSLGALIIAIAEMCKRAARKNSGNNLVGLIFRCIVACVAQCIQTFSRFAVIMTAITGESFCVAATAGHGLLGRYFTGAYITDRVGYRVLYLGAFVMSAVVGVASFLLYFADQSGGLGGLGGLPWYVYLYGVLCMGFPTLGLVLLLVPRFGVAALANAACTDLSTGSTDCTDFASAFVAGVFTAIIAHFTFTVMAKVIIDTMDTMFICYAIDKDSNQNRNPALHKIVAVFPGVVTATVVTSAEYQQLPGHAAPPVAQPYQAPQQQYQYQKQGYGYQGV